MSSLHLHISDLQQRTSDHPAGDDNEIILTRFDTGKGTQPQEHHVRDGSHELTSLES